MGITVDYSDYTFFFDRLRKASSKSFQKEFKRLMEGCAIEFLSLVQNAILAHGNVDTRLMLNSFHKGGDQNVWIERNMGYEVGSNVYYIIFVNNGHHTRGGGRWIEGSHFWEEASRVMEHEFPKYVQAKFSAWMRSLI